MGTSNSTRLSLALADLPLTPFGMKSPASKYKSLKENEGQTKLSRLRLKSPHEAPTPSPENFDYPLNLQNVNTRRKLKKSIKKCVPLLEDLDENILSNSDSQPSTKTERRDTMFTDIDEGSFVEFVEKSVEIPPPTECDRYTHEFYYTSMDNNETRFSTSSKTPLAPVGFHRYVDAVKSKKLQNPIIEDLSSRQNDCFRDKNLFELDETIITGSRDILHFKRQTKEKVNNIMNSTEHSCNNFIVHKLPNLSTVRINNSSSNYKTRNEKDVPFNSNKQNGIQDIECIVLSETEDELCDNRLFSHIKDTNLGDARENHRMKNVQQCTNSGQDLVRNQEINSSLISEDVSILSSLPENDEVGNKKSRNVDKDVLKEVQYFNSNKDISGSESLISEDVSILSSNHQNEKFENKKSKKLQKNVQPSTTNKDEFTKGSGTSLISEDISILSPVIDNRKYLTNHNNNASKNDPTTSKQYLNSLARRDIEEKTGRNDATVTTVDARIASWVLSSPFKNGSFGTSFMDNPSFRSQRNGENRFNKNSEQSLSLRLSEGNSCSNNGSGKTVFTLERVAEELPASEKEKIETVKSPTNKEQAESPYNIHNAIKNVHKSGRKNREDIVSDSDDSETGFSYPKKLNKDSPVRRRWTPFQNRQNRVGIPSQIICSPDSSDNETNNKLENVSKNKFYSSDNSSSSEGIKTSRTVCSRKVLNDKKSSSNLVLVFSSSDTENSQSSKKIKKIQWFHSKNSLNDSSDASLPDIDIKLNLGSSKSFSDESVIAEGKHVSSSHSSPIFKSKSKSKTKTYLVPTTSSDSDLNTSELNVSHENKLKHTRSSTNLNLKLSSIDKNRSILKSKSHGNINLGRELVLESDSSYESVPDIDNNKKPLIKSKTLKPLPYEDHVDSGKESTLQKIRKELDQLYSDTWKKNETKVLQTKNFDQVHTTSHSTSSKSLEKNRKLNSIEQNSIPVLHFSSSDESSEEDNFDKYINSVKKATQNRNKKKVLRKKQSSDNFIVPDSDASSSHSNSSTPVKTVKPSTPLIKKGVTNEANYNFKFKYRSTPRLFISSSSESEEERIQPKKVNKILKPKTPKQSKIVITNKPTCETKKPSYSNGSLSFLSSLNKDTPLSKAHPNALPFLKNFKKEKESLTLKLYDYFNLHMFTKQLPSTMNIKWNPRLTKTAGYCYYQMDKSKPNGRGARIELSSKVIDAPGRLRDTLVHELCHAASWIISGYKDGHGPLWKAWASKAMKTFPELPLINRCHSYEINCKYTYRCTKCGYSIGRHSKSLDTSKKVCGHCFGKFELLVNYKPKSSSRESQVKAGTPKLPPSTPRTPSAFALYVKGNYGSVKRTRTDLKHGDIMRALGEEFAKLKTNK